MPALGAVLDLYYHADGRLGPDVLDKPAPLVAAVNEVASGAAWARSQEK